MQKYVRGVDGELYKKFMAAAERDGLTAGQAMAEAMILWVAGRLSLRDIKPVWFGKGTVRLSERADDIAYGKNERKR